MGDKIIKANGAKANQRTPKSRIKCWCGKGRCGFYCEEGFPISGKKSFGKTKNLGREKHKQRQSTMISDSFDE